MLASEEELCFIELVIVFIVDIILIYLCCYLSLQRADNSFRGVIPDVCGIEPANNPLQIFGTPNQTECRRP
jgi:hypothetical protein